MSNFKYRSPIEFKAEFGIKNNQHLHLKGKHRKSVYNPNKQIFEVQDKIILTMNHKHYRLEEYHFHLPGEHKLNHEIYPVELHYVFYEIPNEKIKDQKRKQKLDICDGGKCQENILIIGVAINLDPEVNKKKQNLSKIPIHLPCCYFEYDGGLIGNDEVTPVRWIFGRHPISMKIDLTKLGAKAARSLQPFDNRILLIGYY